MNGIMVSEHEKNLSFLTDDVFEMQNGLTKRLTTYQMNKYAALNFYHLMFSEY
jgi:hypothetical protein